MQITATPTPTRSTDTSGPRRRLLGDTEWSYRVDGHGPNTLLALPGAVAGGTLGPRLGRLLEGEYRVITPIYPAISTVDAMVSSLAELLDAEHAPRVAVLGGSFGALLAQCLVRSHPQRLSHLILAGGGVPDPRRAEKNRRFLRILPWLPVAPIRWLLRLVGNAMARRAPSAEVFDVATFHRDINGLTRDDLVARYELAIDFDSRQSFAAGDLDSDLPVLLLDGAEDRIARDQQPKLRALYP